MLPSVRATVCPKLPALAVSFRFRKTVEHSVAALHGQRVLLGVSGGIAAYKAAELVRRLRDAGAEVRVVMTTGAQRFITALTLQALSGNPVRTSLWDEAAEAAMGHIELARWATRILIAPASADLLARLALGRADDLLTTLCLASEAPLAVAPAMNRVMWAHPATQAHIGTLRARGAEILGPASGEQACGETGEGRMSEPQALVDALSATFAPQRLVGKRILVSAGPTFEDIDPVRFLGNRSSGRMGFALAAAAAKAGAEVTLVAGPVRLATPAGVSRIDVRSAAQMREALLSALPGQHAYIGAAAVADYRPAEIATQKIKKGDGPSSLVLERTVDILAEIASHPQRPACLLGFAAETHDVETYARGKLEAKRLDGIAANRVGVPGQGFDADENALTLYWNGGHREYATASKSAIAMGLIEWVADWLERK
jgi:phosphopantothenoylcysteine decarboxylase/phosphopantothenate--cysteine ligase